MEIWWENGPALGRVWGVWRTLEALSSAERPYWIQKCCQSQSFPETVRYPRCLLSSWWWHHRCWHQEAICRTGGAGLDATIPFFGVEFTYFFPPKTPHTAIWGGLQRSYEIDGLLLQLLQEPGALMTKTMEAMLLKSAKLRDLHAQIGGADDPAIVSTRSVSFWAVNFINQQFKFVFEFMGCVGFHAGPMFSPSSTQWIPITMPWLLHWPDSGVPPHWVIRFWDCTICINMPDFNLPELPGISTCSGWNPTSVSCWKMLRSCFLSSLIHFQRKQSKQHEIKFTDVRAHKLNDSGSGPIQLSNLSKGQQSYACWDDVPVWGSMHSPKLWG